MRPIYLKDPTEDRVVAIFGKEHNGNHRLRLAYDLQTGWFICDVAKTYAWKLASTSEAFPLHDELDRIAALNTFGYILIAQQVTGDFQGTELVGKLEILGWSSNLNSVINKLWPRTVELLKQQAWVPVDHQILKWGMTNSFMGSMYDLYQPELDEEAITRLQAWQRVLITFQQESRREGWGTLDEIVMLCREGRYGEAISRYVGISGGEVNQEQATKAVESVMSKWFSPKEIDNARKRN